MPKRGKKNSERYWRETRKKNITNIRTRADLDSSDTCVDIACDSEPVQSNDSNHSVVTDTNLCIDGISHKHSEKRLLVRSCDAADDSSFPKRCDRASECMEHFEWRELDKQDIGNIGNENRLNKHVRLYPDSVFTPYTISQVASCDNVDNTKSQVHSGGSEQRKHDADSYFPEMGTRFCTDKYKEESKTESLTKLTETSKPSKLQCTRTGSGLLRFERTNKVEESKLRDSFVSDCYARTSEWDEKEIGSRGIKQDLFCQEDDASEKVEDTNSIERQSYRDIGLSRKRKNTSDFQVHLTKSQNICQDPKINSVHVHDKCKRDHSVSEDKIMSANRFEKVKKPRLSVSDRQNAYLQRETSQSLLTCSKQETATLLNSRDLKRAQHNDQCKHLDTSQTHSYQTLESICHSAKTISNEKVHKRGKNKTKTDCESLMARYFSSQASLQTQKKKRTKLLKDVSFSCITPVLKKCKKGKSKVVLKSEEKELFRKMENSKRQILHRQYMSEGKKDSLRIRETENKRKSRNSLKAHERDSMREKESVNRRLKRAALAQEMKDLIRDKDSVNRRLKRAEKTQDMKDLIKDKDSVRRRLARAELAQDKKDMIRDKNSETRKLKRAELAQDMKDLIRDKNSETRKIKRQKLTNEVKDMIRVKNSRSRKLKRNELTKEMESIIRDKDSKSRKRKRSKLTKDMKDSVRDKDSESKRHARRGLTNVRKQSLREEDIIRKKKERHPNKAKHVIERFKKLIRQYPEYVCTCCRRMLYKRSVVEVQSESYKDIPEDILLKCITGRKSVRDKEWLCYTCKNYVSQSKIPPQANCNDLDLKNSPKELSTLTALERRLISRRYPFMKLITLPKGKQSSIKGSVVNIPVNEQEVCSTLPKTPSEAGFIPIKLKRRIEYKSYEKFEYVRPYKVLLALQWLKAYNPLYKDIEERTEWEDICIEEDADTWKHITNAENAESSQLHESNNLIATCKANESNALIHGKSEPILGNNPTEVNQCSVNNDGQNKILTEYISSTCNNSVVEINQSSDGNIDNASGTVSEGQEENDVLSKLRGVRYETCIQNTNPILDVDKIINLAPGQGKKPLSILMDENFEELSFPHLLPQGQFGWNFQRRVKLTPKKYFQKRLLDEHPQFAQDIEYMYVAQYICELSQIKDSMSIALRKTHRGNKEEPLTASLLKNTEAINKFVFKNQAYRYLQPIRGSPPYWQKVQYKLLASIKQLGIFTFFFTLSAADLKWHDTIQAIARQQGENLTDEQIDSLSWEQKCTRLRSNPITAARHFQFRLETLIHEVILSDSKPLGPVQHFFYRIEFQLRGSPHAHGVLWIKDAPQPDTASDEEIVNFVNKYIQCSLPSEQADPEMYSLVNRLQRHSHSAACKKSSKKLCRFNFPKPISTRTIVSKPLKTSDISPEQEIQQRKAATDILATVKQYLNDTEDIDKMTLPEILSACNVTSEVYHRALEISSKDTTIYLKREATELCINNYNPTLLKSWEANMDIQYVSSPYGCINYVVSYITKEEREMAETLQAVSEQVKDQGIKEQMKKCGHKFLNARSVSAQEAVYRILGLPLYKSDFTTVWIPTGMPSERVSLLKPKYIINKLEDDEEDLYVSGIVEKYSHRPKSLDKWCLAHFAAWYDNSSKSCENDIEPGVLADNASLMTEEILPDIESAPRIIKIQLPNMDMTMKKRSKQVVIRFHVFPVTKEPESFYHSELMLFTPWRNEEPDLLCGYQSYEESYQHQQNTVNAVKSTIQNHSDLIEAAVQELEEHGPQENAWDNIAAQTIQENEDDSNDGGIPDEDHAILDPGTSFENNAVPLPNPQLKGPSLAVESSPTLWTDDEFRSHVQSLNTEQFHVFQIVLNWCEEFMENKVSTHRPKPLHLFISGGAGTGKSHLIKALYQMMQLKLRKEGEMPDMPKVLLLAPTGVAAFNIEGATIHSALLLLLGQAHSKYSKDKSYKLLSDDKRNELRSKLSELVFIIVDEISMVGSDLLLQVHNRLNELFGTEHPFGGISVLAFGDLFQLPPVGQKFVFLPPSDKYACLGPSLWEANFKHFQLNKIMRQEEDQPFAAMLNRIRDGSQTVDDIELLKTRCISDQCQPSDKAEVLHVYSWNKKVDEHNMAMLQSLPNPVITVEATDKVPGSVKNYKPSDDARFTGGLPKTLHLAKGAQVMLIRNIDVSDGLANGSRGTIVDFIFSKRLQNKPLVAVLVKFDGRSIGKNARNNSKFDLSSFSFDCVPIEPLEIKFSFAGTNVKVSRAQFPLKLSWACTIHKVQGLTVREIVVSFDNTFKDGQAYVALSRAKTLNGLFLENFDEQKLKSSSLVNTEMTRLQEYASIVDPCQCILSPANTVTLTIMLLNARSARLHFQDIKEHPLIQKADILCFTETHYTLNELDNFQLPGYNLSVLPASTATNCHGLAIYVKFEIVIERQDSYCSPSVETLDLHTAQQHLILVYRSPSAKPSDFMDHLTQREIFTTKPDIILGDFNMNRTTSAYRHLEETMKSHQYSQIVNAPTHVSGSTLDLVFVQDQDKMKIYPFSTYFSDHKIIFITHC